MNTNPKQPTGKTHSASVCRGIVMLFGLFAFIWLPTLEVDAALQLISPTDGDESVEPVTVFRWTRSDNPAVHSYRLNIAEDPNLDSIDLDLPKPGDSIIAPQVAVPLKDVLAPSEGFLLFWRVIGLDQAGDPVEQSQQVFSFRFFTDQRGFTVITGLVKSDLNQLGLVGARVAVSSSVHAGTTNSIVETVFNGQYIAIAVSTDDNQVPIPFPIEITSTKDGFRPTTVQLQESEKVNGAITRDLVMISDLDGDGDGITDATENASPCLDAADADTDDDGIADGDEDTNKNGVKDSAETDPCRRDTDNDGIQDGTELGLTLNDIGADTDRAIFQPDLDPSTKTDPLDNDSDDDGRLDGEEDANHNGQVDAGETDPNSLRAGALPAILSLLLGD